MAILIGIVIGLVLGLTGAGGSVLAVPLLVIMLKLSFADAAGIALGAVATGAASGALQRARAGQVLWAPALILGAGGMLLAPVGKWLAIGIPELWLTIGFVCLAVIIAVRMWRQAILQPETLRVIRAGGDEQAADVAMLCRFSPTGQFQLRPRCIAGLAIGGLVVGLLSGLFGVGGGFLIVPLLLQLSSVPYTVAVATSLVVITAVALSGFTSYLMLGNVVSVELLLQVAFGAVLGMGIGFVIGKKLAGATLQKIFSVAVIGLSLLMLLKLFT